MNPQRMLHIATSADDSTEFDAADYTIEPSVAKEKTIFFDHSKNQGKPKELLEEGVRITSPIKNPFVQLFQQ